MKYIKKIFESTEKIAFEDIKVAFSDISDDNMVSFYYGEEVYNRYTEIFVEFTTWLMKKHVLVSISAPNDPSIFSKPKSISEISNYCESLDQESKIYKSIHDALLKCDFDSVQIKRYRREILVCITLM